jgi:parallel beta-helix repeat protein
MVDFLRYRRHPRAGVVGSSPHAQVSRAEPSRLASILVAAGIALLLSATGARAAVVEVRPSQDTYVDATAPSRGHGSAKTLRLTARPLRRAYLRFDVRELEDTFASAKLRLYLKGRSAGRVGVNRLAPDQTWSERRTTYSRAPAIASGAVRSKRMRRRGWVSVDVTKLVASGRFADLALSGSPAALVSSSEGSRSPRLAIKLPDPAVFTPGPITPPTFPPVAPPPPVTPPANVAPVVNSTLYVDRSRPNCSNTGPGTGGQPFCTIGAAASRATVGTTVQVASGTYPEAVTVADSGTSTAPIVFTAAPGATVTVTGQANGFVVSARSWVTIAGFNVTNTTGVGIKVSDSSRITLSGNHVSYAGQPVRGKTSEGIFLANVTDSLVSRNTADHNAEAGILLKAGSSGNEVSGNVVFSNARGYVRAAPGIRVYSAPGNTVAGNIAHHNEDSGIEFYTGSNDSLAYNNVTYENGDHGIDNYQSTHQRIVANTVYKSVTAGINVEGSSSGATIANNVSVDNGINSPPTKSNIRVDSSSVSGTTMDYDLVRLSAPGTVVIWNSTGYSSLASFRSATGEESRGIEGDPKWKSPGTGDFHLTAGSPATDSADSAASGQPAADVEGGLRFDDPGTPNTGGGLRSYDDRGAYELRPAGDAPPTAVLEVSPSSGTVDLSVLADASGSSDPDVTPIASYSFDFGDGSAVVGPQSQATAAHTYTQPGSYTVTVTVTDAGGLTGTARAQVEVAGSTNLVSDGGFEVGTSGWNISSFSGPNITLARVAGGRTGGWAGKVTNT